LQKQDTILIRGAARARSKCTLKGQHGEKVDIPLRENGPYITFAEKGPSTVPSVGGGNAGGGRVQKGGINQRTIQPRGKKRVAQNPVKRGKEQSNKLFRVQAGETCSWGSRVERVKSCVKHGGEATKRKGPFGHESQGRTRGGGAFRWGRKRSSVCLKKLRDGGLDAIERKSGGKYKPYVNAPGKKKKKKKPCNEKSRLLTGLGKRLANSLKKQGNGGRDGSSGRQIVSSARASSSQRLRKSYRATHCFFQKHL